MEKDNLNPQSLTVEFKKAYRVIFYDTKVVDELSKDLHRTNNAVLILALAIISNTIGILGISDYLPQVGIDIGRIDAVSVVLVSFALEIVSICSIAFAAKTFFNAKLEIYQFFRPVGYANLVKILNIIPFFAIISGSWYLVIEFKILRHLSKISFFAALSCILFGIFAVFMTSNILALFGFDFSINAN